MELNVNYPAYYKDHYGIDDSVYRYFQKVHLYFLDKEYSDTLKIIGISPMVVPQELCNSDNWKEFIRLINNKNCAIVSLKIDFEEYNFADSVGKIQLTKDLIIKAIRRIKSKVDFDCEAFEQDFNQLLLD